MKKVFGKLKNKKNKWFFYVIFWIFFPLVIIGMIVSLCYSPNSFTSDKSSAYVKSLEFKLNFSNSKADINSELNTELEAKQAASNYLTILKKGGFTSVNVQPYVYSETSSGSSSPQYFYGLNLIFPEATTSKILSAYLYINTFYDNSNLMTLDEVTTTNTNNIVQNAYSSSSGTTTSARRTYYSSQVVVGLEPTDNENNQYVTSGNSFNYSTIKLETASDDDTMYVNLTDPYDFSGLINNSKEQLLWWNNKAAFVTLCDNLYSLYWFYENWYSLSNIPAQYYTNQAYAVIQSLLSEVSSAGYGTFAQDLYKVVGATDWQWGTTTSGSLTNYSNYDYNLISFQNIDNILFSTIPGTSETLYSEFASTLKSYILADITSSNYTTYFTDIAGKLSSTMKYDMNDLFSSSDSSSSSSDTTNEINLQITRWKNNMLNPIQSPKNIRDTNTTTYTNVNSNPFSVWNEIDLLENVVATSSTTTSSSSETSEEFAKPTTKTSVSKTNKKDLIDLAVTTSLTSPIINWNINANQPTSISYTAKYMLTNSITHLSAWSAGLITILVIVLLIGIIVSVLYRFPGLIAWVLSTFTLGVSAIIYESLSIATVESTFLAYMIAYVISICFFIIFLEKVQQIYRTGISYRLSLFRGIRYYVTYSLDLHVVIFLFAISFVYFASFQLQTIGIITAIYFALSFLINYLFGWVLYLCYAYFDFEGNYNFFTDYWSHKINKKNYDTLSEIAFKFNPNSYYNLADLDVVLATKNTLSIYLKPTKRKKILFWALNAFAISMMVVFFSIMIAFYVQHHLYQYTALNGSITYNILGDYLFNNLLINVLIATGVSSIYMFLRFAKAILFFFTSTLSCYVLITFFYIAQISQTVINTSGLLAGLFFTIFIAAYCNITVNHLFRFKQEIKVKDALNSIINILDKNLVTYIILSFVVLLMMSVSYVANSESYFFVNFLLFLPFIFTYPICVLFIPWIRILYLVLKNLFYTAESNIKIKNYEDLEEELIEGINSFQQAKRENFIYE